MATLSLRRRLASACKHLLAFRGADRGPLPWIRALLGTSVVLTVGLLAHPPALEVPGSLGQWGVPAAISVEVAINRVAFNRASHVDERVCRWLESANDPTLTFAETWTVLGGTVNERLREDPHVGVIPLLELPSLTAGADDLHVARLAPYAHNESSITLVFEALLRIHPELTLWQGLQALHAIRLMWLWIFALALLRGGASPLLALASTMVALGVLGQSMAVPPLAAAYASLMPALLGWIGSIALLIGAGLPRRPWAGPAWCLVAGAGAVFLSNLRTSYSPIVATLLLAYLIGTALDLRRSSQLTHRRRVRLWTANALAILLGAFALDRAAFAPARTVDTDLNAHYHVLAHPLVLSLALPPNELSVSERIEWNDYCGISLARREDPTVKFQRQGYEAALFAYYRRLWRERTGDMLRTYATKFGAAGVSALDQCRTEHVGRGPAPTLMRIGTLPLVWVRHGALFAILTLAFVALGWWYRRKRVFPEEGCWLLASIGGTALLCYLESALIVSTYFLSYHGMLNFFAGFAGLAVLTFGLDQLRGWSQRRR